MPKFTTPLTHWNTDLFNSSLKSEIQNLKSGVLPLHLATTRGGMVDDSNISASIINSSASKHLIQAKVGVFFNEIIGGCNCHDAPASENTYCEILVSIDLHTAETTFSLIAE